MRENQKKQTPNDRILSPELIEQMTKNAKVRRAIVRESHLLFFYWYFSNYATYAIAPFHRELFAITEDNSIPLTVIEAFRGSAKTTVMALSYPIWAILGKQQKKFVLLLGQTQEQARRYLGNIKRELETNKRLKRDLGPFEEPDDEWRQSSIVISRYNARIMAASSEQAIRGMRHLQHRPDLIIADDLEDLALVRNKENRDKLEQWFMGDVVPAGDVNTRIIVSGTRLHDDALIARLQGYIREGQINGITRSYPLLDEKGRIAWPGKYPTLESIERERRKMANESTWQREYLLRNIPEDDQVVFRDWIKYYDELPAETFESNFRYAALGIDLAISEKESADYTAMVAAKVYGRKQALRIYVLPHPVNARLNFPKTVERAKSISRTISPNTLAHLFIESTGYQKAMVDHLRFEGYPAEEYQTRGEDKRARLTTVTPLIQSGQILFPRNGANKMIEQLIGFGRERHDDLADAFAILISKIIERDKIFIPQGYVSLVSEYTLEKSYVEKSEFLGETRIGVVLADVGRTSSVIVVRGPRCAQVYYREYDNNIVKLATKVIDGAKKFNVPMSETYIFIDRSGRGEELAEAVKELATNERLSRGCEYLQQYGHNMGDPAPHEENRFHNRRAQAYWRFMDWLRDGGKLVGPCDFDDLLSLYYTEESDREIKIVSRRELEADGIDASVPEALMVTFALEKTHNIDLRPQKQSPYTPWSSYETT